MALFLLLCAACARAQQPGRVEPQPTAEDVLAALVHHAAAIFSGEVYGIRVPQGAAPATTVVGGRSSSRSEAVDVAFLVDVGIRGASIGSNYVLRMPLKGWERAPSFRLHERAVVFLRPKDGAGLSGPVEGEADIPGLDLGVMPMDAANNVDLSRLHRMVTRKHIQSAAQLPPMALPRVPDVGRLGQSDRQPGVSDGRMPELHGEQIPFLALMRALSVLNAAER